MSNCTNCFNGCTEIVSDRCVKYTGIDIPELGIQTGDTLSSVESSIVDFLVPVLTGVGVKPIIDNSIICTTVRQYLPTCTICTGFTLNEVLSAIIKATCDLQDQIDVVVAELAILNANYTLPVDCLTGVTASSDTHAIVQAVINKLCALNSDFEDLLIDLPNTYVAISDLDILIQDYLDNTSSSLISNKMIPYTVIPYFGPLTFFDSTGAGTGNWDKIYLCNGNNGAPDLRGRGLVGAINGVPGGTLNPTVDPAVSAANPNYSLYDVAGANQVTLTSTQIPAHTHIATSTDSGHTHQTALVSALTTAYGIGSTVGGIAGTIAYTSYSTLTSTSNAIINTTISPNVGGGLPHANIQPVTACYYIQYRP